MESGSSFSSKASDSDYGYGSSMSSSQVPSRGSFCSLSQFADQSSLVSLISEIGGTDSDSLEQLERENLHFSIAESVIQVFEQMKWASEQTLAADRIDRSKSTPLPGHPSSCCSDQVSLPGRIACSSSQDEEIGKQWMRIRGRFASDEELDLSKSPSQSSLNDSDIVLTRSMSSQSMAEPLERLEASGFLSVLKDWGVSLSNTSLFSHDDEPDTKNVSQDTAVDTSAENIACSLLRRLSLPNNSEVQKARTDWIIAEDTDDVPQKLLPIPNSTPISPDQVEEEMVKSMVKLRGNSEWAPPRKQIIFSMNCPKSGSKKSQMALQNFRCAGCGQRIEPVYYPRMLFCYYTGKYFCQFGCHKNKKSVIPAFVLNKWDFRPYPVSHFAFNLIKSIRSEKLFDLQSQNFLQPLQRKSRSLSKIIYLRSQLIPLRQYITSCRRGGNVRLSYLIFEPKDSVNFIARDLYLFSLDDMIRIKADHRLIDRLEQLVQTSVTHISSCSSCQAKGFYCEICSATSSRSESDLIFPFEFGRVTSCQVCGSCVHSKCLNQTPDHKCLKCKRRQLRTRTVCSPETAEDGVQAGS